MQAASVLGAVATAIVTKLLLCATNDNTFGVCQASHLSATVIVALIAVAVCFLLAVWRGMSVQPTPQSSATRPPALLFFVVLATILHSAFQLSSSFVEEEHQVWYFFGKAMLLALALLDWRLRRDTAQRQRVPGLGADLASRNAQAYMSCWGRWCLRNGETMSWAVVLLAHCGLSHLNQTGDKWLALPDAGDWLVEVAHRGWNSAFVGGGETSRIDYVFNTENAFSVLCSAFSAGVALPAIRRCAHKHSNGDRCGVGVLLSHPDG